MKNSLLFIFIVLLPFVSPGQEDSTSNTNNKRPFKDIFSLRGYLKEMQTYSYGKDYLYTDNLIHNRLNFRTYISKSFTAGIESRNRVFWGESIKLNPLYGEQFDKDNGLVDMAFNIYEDDNIIVNSTFDRLWLKWENDKWNIRAGRQRINWGINNFWNANDIFNAYNFTDFDYEERPGSDAIKIERYLKGGMNSFQLAVKPSKDDSTWIAGALYRFNTKGYDIQFLSGLVNKDMVLGGGWAGNIKNAGFKGEITYFHPTENNNTNGQLSASISTEFLFGKNLYTTIGALYNSGGFYKKEGGTFTGAFTGTLSAKNLMPTKYSFLFQQSYPVSPLSNFALITMYAPGDHLLLLMPTYSYSLTESWDLSLFAQSYFMEISKYKNLGNSAFLRIKYSF